MRDWVRDTIQQFEDMGKTNTRTMQERRATTEKQARAGEDGTKANVGRRGLGGVYLRGGVWWVRYSYRGRKTRESSGSRNRADAVRLLKKRLGEMGRGRLVGPDPERVALADLRTMLLDDYGLKGNRTAARARQCMEHVFAHLGENCRALDVTMDRLVGYAKRRQEEDGAAAATVKNELALLKRAFNLAVTAGRIPHRPAFPVVQVNNRRTGFFESGEFGALVGRLPKDVRPVAEFLYWTGWRKREALSLEWRAVDLGAGVIRLERTKNGEARVLPYRTLPALVRLLEQQRERADAIQQDRDAVVAHVFTRADGRPIRDFRKAWTKACAEAGLHHRLAHDFRRTAARNLSRAGVPERVIMDLCGWKTRSVFDRYRITNEADLAEGLAKLATYEQQGPAPAPARVVRLQTGTERAQKKSA